MSFGGQMVEMILTVEMVEAWHGDSLYHLPRGRRHQRQCLRHPAYFALLKRGNFGVYHHWGKKCMPQYLREFDWSYNVRTVPDIERTVLLMKAVGGKRLYLKPPNNN